MTVLIVGGCSVAHGCETYNSFMHSENVKRSFSQALSDRLQTKLCNVALSGSSNDYIFFSVLKAIEKNINIHSVIVSWTSLHRLTWKNHGRYWMFNPRWATSIKSPDNSLEFDDWQTNVNENGVWFNSDQWNYIDVLKSQHKFFVENYLDDHQTLIEKLSFYSQALRAVCQTKNLKLVEVTPFSNSLKIFQYGANSAWSQKRHPTAEEHVQIANEIFDNFYAE